AVPGDVGEDGLDAVVGEEAADVHERLAVAHQLEPRECAAVLQRPHQLDEEPAPAAEQVAIIDDADSHVVLANAFSRSASMMPETQGEARAREFIKTFPCTGCGAKLAFAPGTQVLRCEHCGTENRFESNDARIEELDFAVYLKALEGRQETFEAEAVKCGKC